MEVAESKPAAGVQTPTAVDLLSGPKHLLADDAAEEGGQRSNFAAGTRGKVSQQPRAEPDVGLGRQRLVAAMVKC